MKWIQRCRRQFQIWSATITKQLRKVNIFKRLTFSFLGLLIGTSVFLTLFSFYNYSEEVIINLERYASMSVQNIQLKVKDILEEYEGYALQFYEDEDVLRAVAENEQVTKQSEKLREENRRRIERKLFRVGMGRKYIKSIQLVTGHEQYHMAERGYRRGGTIRDLDRYYSSSFFQDAVKKHGYPVWSDHAKQSEIFYESDQSVYGMADIITLSIAIYEPSTREFLGVLSMNVDIKAFEGASRGFDEYRDGNFFLIGQNGVLTGFQPSIDFPSFPADQKLFRLMKHNGKDAIRTTFDGKDVLFVYENVEDTDLFSVYVANMHTILSHLSETRNLSIVVLIVVVIGCLIISYYVTRSISDPIRRLVKVMGKAGDGKWTVRYENSGNDEITVLGDRFNEMADKTNQLIEQVYVSEIRRQKMQLSWKNAQLDAMLMQINPHFLYNTLDIIRWEAMYEANGESRVTEMIEKFSKLCRMGMKAGSHTISLKESLEHASVYLDVINFRHKEKIQVVTTTTDDANMCFVPQFMLQPILENAVVHGFHDGSKGCMIEIIAKVQEDILSICVKDNGQGMSEEELKMLRTYIAEEKEPKKSIGIVNVNQRIRLFYGDEFGIQIESKHLEGTSVEIRLPVRLQSENMKKMEE